MNMLEPLFSALQARPFALRSVPFHVARAFAFCAVFAVSAYGLASFEQSKLQRLQAEAAASQSTVALPVLPAEPVSSPLAVEWPLRQAVDEVIQQAGLAARRSGVNIRSLSVSHQAASPAARGRVNLEVSAGGSYAALKAWQSDVLARFPALAVQNLRMQVAAGGAAALESQWTWVLYVGD